MNDDVFTVPDFVLLTWLFLSCRHYGDAATSGIDVHHHVEGEELAQIRLDREMDPQ